MNGDVYGKSFNIGNEKYIDKDGINANSHKVRNVADGDVSATSMDAVNGRQLYNAVQAANARMDNIKSHLTTDINKVGASAAAMASLHPLEYRRSDKVSVAAAVGNYKDATAMAAGVFYRPDPKSMINFSGSIGSNDNMIGVGFSQRFGQTSDTDNMTEDELRDKVNELSKSNKDLNAKNAAFERQFAEMASQIKFLTAKLESMNHASK